MLLVLLAVVLLPVEKHGSCPNGYFQSGGFCFPHEHDGASGYP